MVEGNEELDQEHSSQRKQLAQRNGRKKPQIVLSFKGSTKNGRESDMILKQEELVVAYRYWVTISPNSPGNVLVHVCWPRTIIHTPFSLSKCPSLGKKIHDFPTIETG